MAKLGDMAVGSTININLDSSPVPFFVIHQGLPSSSYDSSCDGSWVLNGLAIESLKYYWNSTRNNDYASSTGFSYLNNNIYASIDDNVKTLIKSVKIPYVNGTGSAGTAQYGSNGLSAKLFLLSTIEILPELDSGFELGTQLSYFKNVTNGIADKEYVDSDGVNAYYWLRDPAKNNTTKAYFVFPNYQTMTSGNTNSGSTYRQRFAMVLDPSAEVDENGNVTVGGSSLGGFVKIGSEYRELSSGYVKIGSEYREITGSFKRIGGEYK